MNVLVGFMSQTGNTRKVAEAIYGEIKAVKDIKSLDEIGSLDGYDLAFIGFPIQAFGPAQQAKSFLEKHSNGKNIALFITHAAPEDHEELPEWLAKCKASVSGANLLGVFDCRGEMSKSIADFMSASNNPKLVDAAKVRPLSIGQPDAERLKRARKFARDIMKAFPAAK